MTLRPHEENKYILASYTPRRFGIAVNVHGGSSQYGALVKHFFRFNTVILLLKRLLNIDFLGLRAADLGARKRARWNLDGQVEKPGPSDRLGALIDRHELRGLARIKRPQKINSPDRNQHSESASCQREVPAGR